MSQLFAWGGQSIGASASASVLPMNIQGMFPLGLTGLISLLPKGLSRTFSSTTIGKHQFFSAQPSLWSSSHMTTEKTMALTIRPLSAKRYLLFNTLSRFVIAFLPRSKLFFFFFLNFMALATICSDFGARENKICHCFHFFPIYLPWSDGSGWHDLGFLNVDFKASFLLSSFTFIKRFCLDWGASLPWFKCPLYSLLTAGLGQFTYFLCPSVPLLVKWSNGR